MGQFEWITEFFKDNCFSSPVVVDNEATFKNSFREKLDRIEQRIKTVNASREIQKITVEMTEMLWNIIEHYYRGAVIDSIKLTND